MVKKWTWAGLLACVIASSAWIGTASAESRLNEILDRGILRVGTTGDWNPMTIRDTATGTYRGFDIDIMKQLAEDLGVELVFVPTDWKTLISGILADKYDMTGSASLSVTRAKVAGYSVPYFAVATVPLTLRENLDRFSDWDDLDKPGVTVAATLGTTMEQQIREFFPNARTSIIEAPARDFQEVLAGRADAHITSNIEAATLVQKYPQLGVVPVSEARARTPLAMLLPQDDQVWINYVNHWITLRRARGLFSELARKWKLETR